MNTIQRLFTLGFVLCFSWQAVAGTASVPDPAIEGNFQVKAPAAVMGDMDSRTVLFDQNGDVRRPPASLTKVMTLYLAFEALAAGSMKLEDKLPVSERAWRLQGSKTFLNVGDMVRVEDLIQGIAVQSGNDACMVVAEHLGGSEEGFAELMSTKAIELGMVNSHFMNSSGLPDPEHYSSAKDLFLLASAVMTRFPQYAHYFREKQYSFNGIMQYNRNKLLWRDPSITGMKTGHTQEAAYCLIATADMEGQKLSAVILGAENHRVREEEALRLLRFGHRNYDTVKLFEPGKTVRKLRVWKGDVEQVDSVVKNPVVMTLPKKERPGLEVSLTYDEPLVAPIAAGQRLGTVVVKLKGKELQKHPVVADKAVAEGGIVKSLVDSIKMKLGME